MMDNTPTLTPRPPHLVLSRSPSRSPSRQHKSDDILSDLSPATTLEAFTTPNGKFRASVEAASPTERAFGIRATLASKKIQEWVDELSQWPWPASAGSAGFETPAAKQRKVSINGNGNTSPARNGRRASREEDEETYVGSLHAQDVIKYETRVEEIQEDMEDLDVEEIKTKVLDTFSPRSRPSSSMSTHPNMPSFFASYTRMEDFTAVVTATVLQALPRLSRLMRLMDIWSVRLTVLRKIPPLLLALDDTETALTSGWQTIKKFDYSHALDMDINDDDVLSRETFDIMRRVLQDKVTELGQELDFMLDTLEGRQDTLPESWLDRMEAIEQDYGEWVVSGDRKVREGEWARTARVRKLAEEERRRKEAEEAAAKKSIDDEKRRLEEAEAARLDELEAERRAKVDAESAEWERQEDERMARLVADAAERKQLEDERLAKMAAEAAAKKQREDEKKAVEEELTVTAEAERQRDISARGDPSVKTLEDESTGSKMIPAVIGAVAGTAVGFAAGLGLQSEGSNTATADHQDDSHSSPISQSEIAKPLDGANDTKLEIKVPKASMATRPRTPTQAIDLETTALQDFVDHAARIGLPVTPKSHGSTVTARPEPSYNPPTPALSSPSSVIRSSTSPTKQIGSGTAEPIHEIVEIRPIDLLLSDETQDEIPSAISTTSAYSSSLPAAEVGDIQPAEYFRSVLSPIKSPRHAFFEQNTPELKSNTTDADTPLPSIEVPEFDESEVSTDLIVDSDITQIDGSSTSKHDVRRSSVYVLNDFPHDLESVDHLAFTSTPASPQIQIGSSDNEHDSNRDSFVSETSTNLTGRNGSVTTSPVKNSFDDSIAFTPASEADTVQNCPEVDEQSPTAGRVGLRYRFASRSPSGSPPPPMHRPPLHLLASPSFERSREASPDPEVLPTPAEASFIHGLAISTASALPSPTKGHNSDDQIQQQISSLLESLPARIRLKEEPDTSPADTYSVRSKKPRGSLTPMYTRSQSSMSNSRSPTPFLTLAPAYARNPRPRPSNGNPDIKLYHLSRSTGEAPIKLFVRLVGEHGERVMVRVGGGWADLGEYLKEYAAHHGRRVNSGIDPDNLGKVEIQDLPPRMASSGSINSFRYSHAPSYGNGRDSPVSRPVSAMEHIRERPRSSLGVRKARKSLGPADEIAAGLKSIPSPSTPLTHSQSQSQDTTPPNNPDNSTSRLSWTPEDEASSLGLAGPRGKRKESDLSMQDKEWVEGMKDKVRQASAEKERRLKIAEKEKDKKFGEMDRIGTTKRLFPKGKDVPRRDSLGGKWRDD